VGDAKRNAERVLGLNNAYMEYLEWADAEKRRKERELKCWNRNIRMC
jgi:hypothetical protein